MVEVVASCFSSKQVNSVYGMHLLLLDPRWENVSWSEVADDINQLITEEFMVHHRKQNGSCDLYIYLL